MSPIELSFDPFTIGNKMWIHRKKIPLSYQEFLESVAKYYDYDDDLIKECCKGLSINDIIQILKNDIFL